MARKSHRDSAVRFVTAKCGLKTATKTRQYDLIRRRVGQKEPPRLGSTICYGQEVGQKEPPRLGSTICYGQTWAKKSHQDSAIRFVTAKRGPERATETRQYDLLRPRVGQKELLRLGNTICYVQRWTGKRHQDSAVRFVTDKSWPERVTKTRQYDLLRPRVGQKKPPRLGSTICYGQELAKKSRSTICYGQELARKSHQDSAVRFVTANRKSHRDSANVGQREPPRLGSPICYVQELARISHQDSAVRFVTAKYGPERATKTRQYDLLRPRVGQKKLPRLGSTICYGQELANKKQEYDLLRPRVGQKESPRLGSTICYGQELTRKSHQDSAVRFVTAKSWPEKATKTRQYDLLRPRVGQKEPPRLGSAICYGRHQDSAVRFVTATSWPEKATYDLLRPRVGQKEQPRLRSTICYGQELARKSHQDSAIRFATAKRGPERATKTRQYDLLPPNVGQKESPRLGSTICYGHTWARKSHRDSAVRFVTAKRGPEKATKIRQYDLSQPRVGQKKPPRLSSTICYGQELARKSHQDSAVRFDTAKRGLERAPKTRQYDLLRPNVGQKEPPRLGFVTAKSWPERATETGQCYLLFVTAKSLARKSHQDSAVRFVTAKSWPENATETRQYDLLRRRVGQKEPPRLGSAICYLLRPRVWPERATKTRQYDLLWPNVCQAKSWPERAPKTRQYDLLRPRVGQKEPFVEAKNGPERAAETRQYDLLRPRVGQKKPPRLGSSICYCQELARKSHQDSAARFVTANRKSHRDSANVGQKEPPRLGSPICYVQELARISHQDSAVRFVTSKSWPE